MDLGRHLGELIRQSDLDVQRCRRDGQLKWNSVLRVLLRLPVEDDFRVHLAQLVNLNIGHGRVLHLLAGLLLMLSRQHVIVHSLVEHAFIKKLNQL